MKRIILVSMALILTAALSFFFLKGDPLRIAEDSSGETVVLLHGLARSNLAMKGMAKRLVGEGYNVQQVGYKSIGETPEEVLQDITDQINACCATLTTPVHIVGHSLGGVLTRAYLGKHKPAGLGKVVLIGSPNKGTPIVDAFKDKWWMKIAGETAMALGTENSGFLSSLPAPDYPLGVIAGVAEAGMSEQIPGDDDGLVPLESTKVEGMSDFIVLNVSHADMRNDDGVFAQLIHYLKEGAFDHAVVKN